jgi:hypothetical protein
MTTAISLYAYSLMLLYAMLSPFLVSSIFMCSYDTPLFISTRHTICCDQIQTSGPIFRLSAGSLGTRGYKSTSSSLSVQRPGRRTDCPVTDIGVHPGAYRNGVVPARSLLLEGCNRNKAVHPLSGARLHDWRGSPTFPFDTSPDVPRAQSVPLVADRGPARCTSCC